MFDLKVEEKTVSRSFAKVKYGGAFIIKCMYDHYDHRRPTDLFIKFEQPKYCFTDKEPEDFNALQLCSGRVSWFGPDTEVVELEIDEIVAHIKAEK
jgi:hypothetical protein